MPNEEQIETGASGLLDSGLFDTVGAILANATAAVQDFAAEVMGGDDADVTVTGDETDMDDDEDDMDDEDDAGSVEEADETTEA